MLYHLPTGFARSYGIILSESFSILLIEGIMKITIFIGLIAGFLFGIVAFQSASVSASPSAETKLQGKAYEHEDIKGMLANLGYEPKDLGENIYEITVTKEGWDVFISVSLSRSKAKMWLVVNLGNFGEKSKNDPKKLYALLQKNTDIQPAQFYIRGDGLRLGVPLDNRALTPALIRKEIDTLADHTAKTEALWAKINE